MVTRVGKLNYIQTKIIGRGSYGTVVFQGYLGLYENDRPVAVKRLQRSHVNPSLIQREVELMKRASDHPNILRCIRTEIDPNFIFIVTELCNATLEDYITDKNQDLPRTLNEWEILYQVTQGLDHLHKLGIVHRDLKPTNILISSTKMMKLADFGMSKILEAGKEDFTNSCAMNPKGTRGWMAPEVYEFDRFDFRVDVWALGLIFGYTLSGGKHPFGDDCNERIVRIRRKEPMLMVKQDLQDSYSRDGVAFQLIESMLEVNPSKRPTVSDLFKKSTFFLFDADRTKQLLDICLSLSDYSITLDQIDQFKQLVSDPTVDIHVTTDTGWTPLHYLCHSYQLDDLIDIILLLIQKRAVVNAKTANGLTPLHLVCSSYKRENLIDIVRLLLEKGADAKAISTRDGKNALHLVCEKYRNENLVELVILLTGKGGSSLKEITKNGSNPLHFLCRNYRNENLVNIVQFMIEKGTDANCRNLDKWTPLHCLCLSYSRDNLIDVVKLLIENGADVNAKTKNGESPLHILCRYNMRVAVDKLINLVKFLVEKGGNLKAKNKNGETPAYILSKRDLGVHYFRISSTYHNLYGIDI